MKFVSYLPAAADSAELFLTPRMSASPLTPHLRRACRYHDLSTELYSHA